jgi:hypothetical protein
MTPSNEIVEKPSRVEWRLGLVWSRARNRLGV